MEQDVDHGLSGYRSVCSACLSSDRNLTAISGFEAIYQVFRLLMYESNEDRYGDALLDIEQLLCWECLALIRKFAKFRKQVQSAQEHLRVLAISQSPESIDHTYMSQSLSTLDKYIKCEYDCIYVDYTASEPVQEKWPQQYIQISGAQSSIDHTYMSQSLSTLDKYIKCEYDCIYVDYTASEPVQEKWPQQYIQISGAQSVKSEGYDVAQSLADPIRLATEGQVLTVPEIVLENVTNLMPHMVVGPDLLQADASYTTEPVKGEISELIIDSVTTEATVILKPPAAPSKPEKPPAKLAYTTEFMSEEEMTAVREEAKKKVTYACSVFKCELCIIGFYTEQQVQDHFVTVHRARPGYSACKVCYVYVEDARLHAHVQQHYTRYVCKLCAHTHTSEQLMAQHVAEHSARPAPAALVRVDAGVPVGKSRKKKEKEVEKTEEESEPPKGNLRKLLSKTTIVGYKCLECDMFFKNTRGRKTHVARYHREGLQCDICKKRFVNRTTLATHLRLHEGPLPREECPICHKMVRTTQLKYHVQRHQNKERYECKDCNKVFLHLTTYQAHLKYSRAHADEAVLKYPCPMCNKGYPTKESMQDHFNYQHLGKTTHKCPICNKPMASRSSVEKHMARVHAEKKEKPRNHICTQCDKAFTDKKALNQHAVIHSGERPLTCDVCQQSFKQKASLYTHRKRVHKLAPAKRTVTYMETAEPRT